MCDIWAWFYPPPTVDQAFESCKSMILARKRELGRSIREIERAIQQTQPAIKKLLKSGDREGARELAKNEALAWNRLARLKSAQNRLDETRQHMVTAKSQMAMGRAMGDAASLLNGLTDLDETRQVCTLIAREFYRAGMIDKSIEEALTSTDESDDAEELVTAQAGEEGDLEMTPSRTKKQLAQEKEDQQLEEDIQRILGKATQSTSKTDPEPQAA